MDAMPGFLIDLFQMIERTSFGEFVRITPNLYPILMALHVLGIAMLVGPAMVVDLRLLGIGSRYLSITALARMLLPVSRTGFGVVVLTGSCMFAGVALTVGSSAAAKWKAGLLILALLNVAVFHHGIYRSVETWAKSSRTPIAAKISALISMLAWTGVIFAGRFLAY